MKCLMLIMLGLSSCGALNPNIPTTYIETQDVELGRVSLNGATYTLVRNEYNREQVLVIVSQRLYSSLPFRVITLHRTAVSGGVVYITYVNLNGRLETQSTSDFKNFTKLTFVFN